MEGPLNKRAWTLQERILPSRVLHYTQSQLIWECYSMTCFEGTSQTQWLAKTQKLLRQRSTTYQKTRDTLCVTSALQKAIPSLVEDVTLPRDVVYQLWYEILSEYTSWKLSFGQDKLGAISGFSGLFSKSLRDINEHGIWKKDIHRRLLWTATFFVTLGSMNNRSLTTAVKRTELEPPSWSWAPLHRIINFEWHSPSRSAGEMHTIVPSLHTADIDCSHMNSGKLVLPGLSQITEPQKGSEESPHGMLLQYQNAPGTFLNIYLDQTGADKGSSPNAASYLVQIGLWHGTKSTRRLFLTTDVVAGLCIRETKGAGLYERLGVFCQPVRKFRGGEWAKRTFTLI